MMARRKCDCSSVILTQDDIIQRLRPSPSTLEGYLIENYNRNSECKDIHMNYEKYRCRHQASINLRRILTSTLLQTFVLFQSLLLVTSQAFPVGCEWSSSISPTMPEFQTVKLGSGSGCATGRLHWHIPWKARQLRAVFQESRGPFQMCVIYSDSSLNDVIQVTDKTDDKNVPLDFPAGEEKCVQSGPDNNVVLNFKLAKNDGSEVNSANDINYSQLDSKYEIVIDVRRRFNS